MTFLGRKLHGNYQGEVLTDSKKKRWPGARVKHHAKENWIKMYDKHGCVLPIETVINQPSEFTVRRSGTRRSGTRRGEQVIAWFPLRQGVAKRFCYAEISRAANRRYLDSLAAVEPTTQAILDLTHVGRSKRCGACSYRGFNPLLADDLSLLVAIFRGEHALVGTRNEDVRQQLFGASSDRQVRRRQANTTSRLVRRLHVHSLLAKIPRSRRWRITQRGNILLSALIQCHYEKYPELLPQLAA